MRLLKNVLISRCFPRSTSEIGFQILIEGIFGSIEDFARTKSSKNLQALFDMDSRDINHKDTEERHNTILFCAFQSASFCWTDLVRIHFTAAQR